MQMKTILILLVLFQVKHWLCDYPLQTPYMLGKAKATGWMHPLYCHVLTHGIGTWLIAGASFAAFGSNLNLIYLGFLDAGIHFAVDRVKASPFMGGRWKPDSRYFWWALGADQAAHHLTHYAIIAAMVWSIP